MDLKELREKFHEKDAEFSSHFHETNKQNGLKKLSMGKIILLLLGVFIVGSLISGVINPSEPITPTEPITPSNPTTKLSLEKSSVNIDQDQTEFIVKGSTEPGATVKLFSDKLNLNNVEVQVKSDGKFEYSVTIPLDVDKATIKVTASSENKNNISYPIYLTRKTPKDEDTSSELTNQEKIDNILASFDFDSNGLINHYEFGYWGGAAGLDESDLDGMLLLFNRYDSDKDGYLDENELDRFFSD